MIKIIPLFTLLLFTSCGKEFKLKFSDKLESYKCSSQENCYSTLESGENAILPFKMMGEDESQNISNISKVIAKIEGLKIEKLQGNYLHISQDDLHIEFLAARDDREIHVKSQKAKVGLFNSNDAKKVIEDIRFKFFQNDY